MRPAAQNKQAAELRELGFDEDEIKAALEITAGVHVPQTYGTSTPHDPAMGNDDGDAQANGERRKELNRRLFG